MIDDNRMQLLKGDQVHSLAYFYPAFPYGYIWVEELPYLLSKV